jgi:hypothetical protein
VLFRSITRYEIGQKIRINEAMSERRVNMKVEQEDDDSDASGWSDADSD